MRYLRPLTLGAVGVILVLFFGAVILLINIWQNQETPKLATVADASATSLVLIDETATVITPTGTASKTAEPTATATEIPTETPTAVRSPSPTVTTAVPITLTPVPTITSEATLVALVATNTVAPTLAVSLAPTNTAVPSTPETTNSGFPCTATVINSNGVSVRANPDSSIEEDYRVSAGNSMQIISGDLRESIEADGQTWIWYEVQAEGQNRGWSPIGQITEGNEFICGCGIPCND